MNDEELAAIRARADGADGIDCTDGEFMAHAREDIPALLAEIDRLSEIIALTRPAIYMDRAWTKLPVPAMEAEIDRLRALVGQMCENCHERPAAHLLWGGSKLCDRCLVEFEAFIARKRAEEEQARLSQAMVDGQRHFGDRT